VDIKLVIDGGEPVPIQMVKDVMQIVSESKVVPAKIFIGRGPRILDTIAVTNANGGARRDYTIEIYMLDSDKHGIQLVYDHESGHLIDYAGLLKGSFASFKPKIDKAYTDAINLPGGPLQGLQRGEAFSKAHDLLHGRYTNPKSKAELNDYYNSAAEVFAEHYAYYKELQRQKAAGKTPAYSDLVKEVSSPERAKEMARYGELFKLHADFFKSVEGTKASNRAIPKAAPQPKTQPPPKTN